MSTPEEYKQRAKAALERYYKGNYERDRVRHEAECKANLKRDVRRERGIVTEHEEQVEVVRWLDAKGLLFCAVPNGAVLRGDNLSRAKQVARLRAEGLRSGAPDLLVFSRPIGADFMGVAIEMKSLSGKVSDNQTAFLDAMRSCGWEALVCFGASDAINKLEGLGY